MKILGKAGKINKEIYMKRKLVIIIFFIVFNRLWAQTFDFTTNNGATVYLFDEEGDVSLNLMDVIKSGVASHDEHRIMPMIWLYFDKRLKKEIAYIKLDGVRGYVSIPNLKPKNTEDLLDDNIISVTDPGIKKRYIPSYMLETLKTVDTKKIVEYDTRYAFNYRDFLKNELNSYIAYGFEKKIYYAVISNIGIKLHSDDTFIFTNIKKLSPTKYECTGVGFSKWNPDRENSNYWQTYFENTSELGVESEIIELTLDGDYLSIFNKTRNKEIITLVCIDDTVEKELINLFNSNNCDLSKVTWSRHADGTSPYDNLNKSAKFNFNALEQKSNNTSTTVASQTNVAVQKTMYTNCNLKLRSGEATTTSVLTVMSAGAKVKILELGKEETIDGINSNWVKVEVISGKDRDGNKLKSGMTGWCYGGYLE